MKRGVPYWYARYFTSVIACFEEVFDQAEPGIYVLLPYKEIVFERDYIHFTQNSGTS